MRVLAAEVLRGESRRFRLDRDNLDFVQYTVQEYRVAYAAGMTDGKWRVRVKRKD
jgi:hypothetical protein